MRRTVLAVVVAASLIISARGQGFSNLDFESAYNLTNANTYVPVANAFPGWTVYSGAVALSQVYYVSNNFAGPFTPVELEGGSLALNGVFSAALFDGGLISQTGLVPASAQSLEFEASSSVDLAVTLGGHSLPYSVVSNGGGYSVYGANIPVALDGQLETLSFGIQFSGQTLIDNIEFSPTSVPEPAERGLIGIGAVLVGLRSRRKIARTGRTIRSAQSGCRFAGGRVGVVQTDDALGTPRPANQTFIGRTSITRLSW
jgi:hypothetical protein